MHVEAPIRADLDSRNIVPSEQLVDRCWMDPKVVATSAVVIITSGLRSIAWRVAEGQETRKEKHTSGGCLSTGTLRFIHRHARQLGTTPA
jgi:hypothetical protein